jgi:pimeloyl-ACP methyl ester carboxylesterase
LLPTLRVPTLVVHGEEDRNVPVVYGRWMAEQIPGARFYCMKGRSHALIFTAAAEFAEVVRGFVRTLV